MILSARAIRPRRDAGPPASRGGLSEKIRGLKKPMSLLLFLCNDSEKNHVRRTVAAFVYVAVLGLSVFLAIMDLSAVDGTKTKVWLFLLAIFAPELYVIMHGISSSSLGLPFFGRTLLELPSAHHLDSPPPQGALAGEIHKAAARIKAGAHAAASALSSVGSQLSAITEGASA